LSPPDTNALRQDDGLEQIVRPQSGRATTPAARSHDTRRIQGQSHVGLAHVCGSRLATYRTEVDLMKRMPCILAFVLVALAGPQYAFAKAAWVKKAQAEDPSIKTCTSCHTSMKSKDLNGRGQFLMDKKKELKASEIDFKWLKDYKETPAKK
jgi:hypothetical protein